MDKRYKNNIGVIRFDVPRNSNLPFYLLAWAQLRLFDQNCLETCSIDTYIHTVFSDSLGTLSCSFCDDSRENMMALYFEHIRNVIVSAISKHPAKDFLGRISSVRYLYYSESDQILNINHLKTLEAITAASTMHSVILGRRRFKHGLKYPYDYDKLLARGPGCGREGFYITGTGGVKEK